MVKIKIYIVNIILAPENSNQGKAMKKPAFSAVFQRKDWSDVWIIFFLLFILSLSFGYYTLYNYLLKRKEAKQNIDSEKPTA